MVSPAHDSGERIPRNENSRIEPVNRSGVILRAESGAEAARTPDASRGRWPAETRASVWSACVFSAALGAGSWRAWTISKSRNGTMNCGLERRSPDRPVAVRRWKQADQEIGAPVHGKNFPKPFAH